ncbi:MAG: methyltransferase domain-containing protein [Planctomyces sp.]|nr:methyltransferase domain-containing protein [Planctomyces sp.]
MDVRKEYQPSAAAASLNETDAAGLPQLDCGWKLEEFLIAGRTLKLALPAVPDGLLDDPSVRIANASDDYMPYWAWLWPASIRMSEMILNRNWVHGSESLELGCGVGMVGIAAMLAGMHVTMTDYDPNALAVASTNAHLNGLTQFACRELDWRTPWSAQFSLIFGCDVLYETRNIEPVLNVIDSMMSQDGVCWLADGGRTPAADFVQAARQRGYQVHIYDADGSPMEIPGTQFQLFELRSSK